MRSSSVKKKKKSWLGWVVGINPIEYSKFLGLRREYPSMEGLVTESYQVFARNSEKKNPRKIPKN